MSIEPISSAMSFQAMPQVRETQPSQAQVNEAAKTVITESGLPDTPVVSETPETANENESEQGKEGQGQNKAESSNESIKKAVEQLNKKMINQNSEAVFGIHEETNRVTIKIVDKTSKKVIKELPPEKTLDMIAKIWEMAGILVDEKK